MRTPHDKDMLLSNVFSAAVRDSRIDFFTQKMTPAEITTLVDLRLRLLKGGELQATLSPSQYELVLPAKTINIGGGQAGNIPQNLPRTSMNCFQVFFNMVVNGQKSLSHWTLWKGMMQAPPKVPFDAQIVALVRNHFLPILLFALFYEPARARDYSRARLVEHNRQSGACIFVAKGCVSSSSNIDDCYKPKTSMDVCDQTSYFLSLCVLTVLCVALNQIRLSVQQSRQRKLQDNEAFFDNPAHDALLAHVLCAGTPSADSIDWSERITVNGSVCTVRTLALVFLVCFDDRMYDHVFPVLLSQLHSGEATFELNHESLGDAVVSVTRTAQLANRPQR